MTQIGVKICGLSTPETLTAAINAGARYVGFVFYPPSPRNVSFDTAWTLAQMVPTGTRSVGLFVDPTDEMLDQIANKIQLDMIQLHGNESPARVAEIKTNTALQTIKAIPIATAEDLKPVPKFEAVADWLLFDTKLQSSNHPTSNLQPPHGGTGEKFDWNILKNKTFQKPWMLAGGLNANNIAQALTLLKPNAIDVSGGVESSPGQKDPTKIKAFINAVKAQDHRIQNQQAEHH